MAVVTLKSRTAQAPAVGAKTPSKVWLNVGFDTIDENGEARFIRLPLGIPVDALKTRPIYDSMSPEFAAEVATINNVIELLNTKGEVLGEGEGVKLKNITIQLYRRKEEVDADIAKAGVAEIDIFAE